ncbi:MAG: hypothetical protein JWP94_2703 [Mucilaginibacter sp.]|nr:hypothetical protein [Mucilaginibacter sp.]
MADQIEESSVSILEILVKTSYHTQITHPTNQQCDDPAAYGSGFIVDYDNEQFFVTADHTVHLDDYKEPGNQRTETDYVVSIFNNVTPPDNFLSTVITPLGGFYYTEQFHLDKPKQAAELLDVTVCKMKPINLKYPFLTDQVTFLGKVIPAGQYKWKIKKECFSEPDEKTEYLIFGKIKTWLEDGIRLNRINTLKSGLKFIAKVGDYFLLNTPEMIADKQDWEGLSGSPVFSITGDCIGVLCSVNEGSRSLWVMPISKVKMMIEIAIQQEQSDITKGT